MHGLPRILVDSAYKFPKYIGDRKGFSQPKIQHSVISLKRGEKKKYHEFSFPVEVGHLLGSSECHTSLDCTRHEYDVIRAGEFSVEVGLIKTRALYL